MKKYLRPKQSLLGSLFESVIAAGIAAPTAIGIHKLALVLTGECATSSPCQDHFIIVVWFVFFVHSFTWKFILRRIFERYYKLEPTYLLALLRSRLT